MRYLTILIGALAFAAPPVFALDCATGFRAFSHAAGKTCIPENPQRIVTLQDQNGLLPLMELGVTPVGSAGHLTSGGERVFRRMEGYDTGSIAWLGSYRGVDAEAVAVMEPDLIIASPWPEDAVDTFGSIAPVVVIDMFDQPLEDALFQFAELVNRTDRAKELQAELNRKAADVRTALGDRLANTTLSAVTREYDGPGFYPIEPTQAFGAIRRALGPTMTPLEKNWETDRDVKSLEVIGEHAADVTLFLTFDADENGASSEFDDFMGEAIVQATPVAQAGQVFVLNGSTMVGSAWGKIENGLDQISAVLLREDLNRDLVIE